MTKEEMIEAMLKLAEKYNVKPTENLPKIANARIRMGLPITVCPCCATGPEKDKRGCISELCLKEIHEDGICHCHCFTPKED